MRLSLIAGYDLDVTIQEDDRIKITAPYLKSAAVAACRTLIETAADLTLSSVHSDSDKADGNGITIAERVHTNQVIVPCYRVFLQESKNAKGGKLVKPILINRSVAIRNEDIKVARKSVASEFSLDLELDPSGTAKMITFTQDLRPGRDRRAIVLDGKVSSAPVVNQIPLGKNCSIEGLNRPGELEALIIALMHPLENRLTVEREQLIRPALGR